MENIENVLAQLLARLLVHSLCLFVIPFFILVPFNIVFWIVAFAMEKFDSCLVVDSGPASQPVRKQASWLASEHHLSGLVHCLYN